MRLAWLIVMKECSTRRSARLRWLGSEDCFCDSRQNSISVRVARPDSTTTRPTSVSRFELMPAAFALLSECAIQFFTVARRVPKPGRRLGLIRNLESVRHTVKRGSRPRLTQRAVVTIRSGVLHAMVAIAQLAER